MILQPHLEILPPSQTWLWPRLPGWCGGFVLYGSTAVSLRYGHRNSVDFDFFTDREFDPQELRLADEWLKNSTVSQLSKNTLILLAPTPHGQVQLSFFGGLKFGRVGEPDLTDNHIPIASPLDFAALKLKLILQRSEAKDYLDLDCLLSNSVKLEEALGAAEAIHQGFPVMWALKAMCYHQEGDVDTIAAPVKERLIREATNAKPVAPVKIKSFSLLPE